jgi:uncharacterized membrane protein YhhN
MGVELAAAAAVAVAVSLVLLGEWRERRWLRWGAKPVASLAFLALGLIRFAQPSPFGAWLLLGLVLCGVGDLALLGAGRAFLVGLVAFLLGHVAYVAAFIHLSPVSDWPMLLVAPVAVASVLAARWLWPHVGSLRVAVAAYIAVITVMVWGALSLVWHGGELWRLAVAGVLFYLSDLLVARQRFVRPEIVNRLLGLPMYYAAQLLFATSIGAL